MYATPGSYKIHLNSQITDRMVSSSATRFTSKAETYMGKLSPLWKKRHLRTRKKPLVVWSLEEILLAFTNYCWWKKILHRLGCPKCIFFYKYEDLFSGILSGAGFCSINCITIGTQWKSSIGAHGNSSGKRGFWGQGADAEVGWAPTWGFVFLILLIFLGGTDHYGCVFSPLKMEFTYQQLKTWST